MEEQRLKVGDYITYRSEKEGKGPICSIGFIVMFDPSNADRCIEQWFSLDRDRNYVYMLSEENVHELCSPQLMHRAPRTTTTVQQPTQRFVWC